QWLEEDHYQPEILKLALREAVLNQAYSFNYVDRILLSWERKNLRTKQQVEEDQKRRKQQLLQREVEQSAQQEELPKVSLKNWLKEEQNICSKQKTREAIETMYGMFNDAHGELKHNNPFEQLIAVI